MGQETLAKIRLEMNRVFVGKQQLVEDVLVCLLAGGHVLLEDVPGVGKTTLARTLANTIAATMGRLQCTPDTLPGDVLGVNVYNMKTGEFEYKEGVVCNQIVLADEINRTSPKTQAALLEAMAEQQITVDGVTYALPQPFMVLATQNPVEFLGTYPLPEAQMDRFMMRLSVGYPDREQEKLMAKLFLDGQLRRGAEKVCEPDDILKLKQEVDKVTVKDTILQYVGDIVELTRGEERFSYGVSPRGMLALVKASQAQAYLQGRDYVKPDDVKAVAEKVLLHRLSLTSEAKIMGMDVSAILHSLVIKAKVPV